MAEYVQLRVSLNGVVPEVWRRIVVPGELNLHELHGVLQGAMGWENYHLYAFLIGEARYELPETEEYGPEEGCLDGRDIRLDKAVRVGESFLYRYDFGDRWAHTVTRERITRQVPNVIYCAYCVEGANACPPEDVGGVSGYGSYLDKLKVGKGDAYRDAVSWRGKFDPSCFSPSQATQAISMICVIMRLRSEGFEWL